MGRPNLENIAHQLTTLPQELGFLILDNLPLIEIIKLKRVSTQLKNFVSSYLTDELKIKEVSCGQDFTLVLLNRGRVLAVGNNSSGQLGLGNDIKKACMLTEIANLKENIQHISTGFAHSLLLGESGTVYGMGRNAEKQVKPDSDQLSFYSPTPIETSTETIFAQDHTSALIDTHNSFKVLGNSLKGYQHRHNTFFLPDWVPALPDNLDVADVSVNNQHQHALLLTRAGEVFACGNNESGFLGLNSKESFINIWTQIPDIKARQIKTTAVGCFILTQDSVLLVSGLNTKGQLGPNQTLGTFTQLASEVTDFDAADHHTVVVVNNNLYHFGAMTLDNSELRTIEKGILPLQGYSFSQKQPTPSRITFKELMVDFFKNQPSTPKQSQSQTKNSFYFGV